MQTPATTTTLPPADVLAVLDRPVVPTLVAPAHVLFPFVHGDLGALERRLTEKLAYEGPGRVAGDSRWPQSAGFGSDPEIAPRATADPWANPDVVIPVAGRQMRDVRVGGDLRLVKRGMRQRAWRESAMASDLSSTAKLVIVSISRRMNDDCTSGFPSVAWIADAIGRGRRTVQHALRVAEAGDWVRRVPVRREDESWSSSLFVPGVPAGCLKSGRGYALDAEWQEKRAEED